MKDKKIEEIINTIKPSKITTKTLADIIARKIDAEFNCYGYSNLEENIKWIEQIFIDFQQEVREETLRELLPDKEDSRLVNETYSSVDGWDDFRSHLISKAKELYNIDLE